MKQPIIKVGILQNQEHANFTLKGNFLLNEKRQVKNERFSVSAKESKIVLFKDDKIIGEYDELKFTSTGKDQDIIEIENVIIGLDFHWERSEVEAFWGNLIVINRDGKLILINEIPLEKYLESVISSEMNAESPIEYLRAHSIISRSWLLAQMNFLKTDHNRIHNFIETDEMKIKWYDREDHADFDVCADDHCQRYQGIKKIIAGNALQAVKDTSGMVLMYDDKICDTRYSKCCGGISEEFQNVWADKYIPYLKSVSDFEVEDKYNLVDENSVVEFIRSKPEAYCNTSDSQLLNTILVNFDQSTTDFFRWKVEVKQLALSTLLKIKLGIDFGEIINLVPLERGKSGRIYKLRIEGTKRNFVIGKTLEIRRALSEKHLYSSAFVVERVFEQDKDVPQKFILHGAGWGHGVGFCQIGGAVMASKGKKFDEILTHYFKGAELRKIYS